MSKKAFTLVELMIVIAIIGILAAALFPSMSNYLARTRDTQRVMDMSRISVVSEQYMADIGRYPLDDLFVDTSCGGSFTVGLTFNSDFTCEDDIQTGTGGWAIGNDPKKNFRVFKSYINKLPIDPLIIFMPMNHLMQMKKIVYQQAVDTLCIYI